VEEKKQKKPDISSQRWRSPFQRGASKKKKKKGWSGQDEQKTSYFLGDYFWGVTVTKGGGVGQGSGGEVRVRSQSVEQGFGSKVGWGGGGETFLNL